jgi:hypothetical protein
MSMVLPADLGMDNQGVDENQMKEDCTEKVVMLKLCVKFI